MEDELGQQIIYKIKEEIIKEKENKVKEAQKKKSTYPFSVAHNFSLP